LRVDGRSKEGSLAIWGIRQIGFAMLRVYEIYSSGRGRDRKRAEEYSERKANLLQAIFRRAARDLLSLVDYPIPAGGASGRRAREGVVCGGSAKGSGSRDGGNGSAEGERPRLYRQRMEWCVVGDRGTEKKQNSMLPRTTYGSIGSNANRILGEREEALSVDQGSLVWRGPESRIRGERALWGGDRQRKWPEAKAKHPLSTLP
jgi:hypothetical protein